MKKFTKKSVLLLAGTASVSLAACSGSSVQNSIEPAIVSQTNPVAQSSLAFAVGTANIAGNASLGLNVVTALRQTAGNVGASILDNAPTITGPAGFTVPAAPDAYTNAGTNTISSTLITSILQTIPDTTFDPQGNTNGFGIASSFGIIPAGVQQSTATPSLLPYPQPFYAAENTALAAEAASLGGTAPTGLQLYYIGGPPAFVASGHTSTADDTFPPGDAGYQLGFDAFQAVPTAGTYTESVVIPTGVNTTTGVSSSGTKTATSTLVAGNVLPAWGTAPVFTPDANGDGGGVITTNFAASGAVTEEYIELVDLGVSSAGSISYPCAGSTTHPVPAGPYYYTFAVAPGTATVTVPASIGPAQPGQPQTPTICSSAQTSAIIGATTPGDDYAVYGFAVDWPLDALVSAEVASKNAATPTITGSAGTDDITLSPPSFDAAVLTNGDNLSGTTLQSRLRGTKSVQNRK